MKLNELKTEWEKEMQITNQHVNSSMNNVVDKVNKFNGKIKRRDFIEMFTAVALITWLGFRWLTAENIGWMVQLGMFVLIAVALFVCYWLFRARKMGDDDSWTLSSRLASEVNKVEKQKKLLNSIGSWYLLPISIGVIFSSLGGYYQRTGTYVPDMGLWLYYIFGAALCGLIYWLNKREAKNNIDPLLQQLKELQSELNKES